MPSKSSTPYIKEKEAKEAPKKERKKKEKATKSGMSMKTAKVSKPVKTKPPKNPKKKEDTTREVKKFLSESTKTRKEAESINTAVETVISNYKDSKNFIKVKLCSNSNEYINAQQLEKAQLTNLAERIRTSEEEQKQMQHELERTLLFIKEYDTITPQNWFTKFINWLY